MLLQASVVSLAIAALAGAVPSPVKHVVHEKRHTPSSDWVKGSRIEGSAIVPMRIGLTQNNLDNGYDYLMEVSDPGSPRYGKYWSSEEVHEKFAPLDETLKSVEAWLTSSGIHHSRISHYENQGWLAFDASIEEVERLLKAEFHEHEHKYSSRVRVGCDEYHLPAHLVPHIDYVTPGVKLAPVKGRSLKTKRSTSYLSKRRSRLAKTNPPAQTHGWTPPTAVGLSSDLQGCGSIMTPTCIKALYRIPTATLNASGNSLGLYEQGDYFAKSDLDLFYAKYAPWIPQGTYPTPALIDGANFSVPAYSALDGGESNIDIDMAFALLYPQTITLYQVDDQIYEPEEVATTNLFNTFLDALDGSYCNYTAYGVTGDDPSIDPFYPDSQSGGWNGTRQCGIYKPTTVISASYGQAEADLPIAYTKRQCNEFMKLGLQGHSILTASGDYGVGSFPGDGQANGCLGPKGTIFNPQYPGNCPYITSVGGTMLYANQSVHDGESVMHVNLGGKASNFTSAGGFSNYFPIPSYQRDAVDRYFKRAKLTYPYYSELGVNVNTSTGIYNRIGRGYPDIAANGAHFPAHLNGSLHSFYGSSLASPLFASVFTLINEERLAIGKGPIGFVNPTLYQNSWALNDIVNGTNVGCGTEGFAAIQGWDPATGLGTPNYPKLKKLFLSLP